MNALTEAESLFIAGAYADAGTLFHRAWDDGNLQAGVRYAACLRLAGYARAALRVCETLTVQTPADLAVHHERTWCQFELNVRPAAQDLSALQQAAETLLAQGAGPALIEAILLVIETAATQNAWPMVDAWCDRVAPHDLDDRTPSAPAQSDALAESPRLRWYRRKTRALAMLNRWPALRPLACEAQALYPQRPSFARLAAQALAGQGRLLDAYDELRTCCARWPFDWSLHTDLARLALQLGRNTEALQLACRAALLPGEDAHKAALFALLAEITAAQGEFRLAAYHVVLARNWHLRQGRPYPSGLRKLEGRLRAALTSAAQSFPDVSADGIPGVRQRCFDYWQAIAKIDN